MLQVSLNSEVSSVGFEALSKLPRLREFLYGEYAIYEEHVRFLLLCAQYLPQLKLAGQSFDFLYGVNTHGSITHNEVVQQPVKLSLADLTIGCGVQLHDNFQVPELESLSLWMPMTNVRGLCERFSSISALGLYEPLITPEAPEDVVIPVLQSVGHRLRSLALSDVPQPLSLAHILELCPRLERLRIEHCNFNDTSDVWPTRHFLCMEEVVVGPQKLPPGFIMQVTALKKS